MIISNLQASGPAADRRLDPAPVLLVVMGVSGCGKSTVGAALAQRLGLPFQDGDTLHPSASVEKMRAGIPLDDQDRMPWLDQVAAQLADRPAWPRGGVVACSALRRTYRDRIRQGAGGVRFLFLQGDPQTIMARLAQRRHPYMPASLLASQFASLENPAADETDVLELGIGLAVEEIVERSVRWLGVFE